MALGLLSLLGTAACSSSDSEVDIGDSSRGERLTDYADEWVGYAEGYEFSDGSDKVRIVLDENGEGTLELGDSEPITLDVDHPPRAARGDVIAGFAYTVRFATVETSRLQLRFDVNESLADWCAAQTAHDYGDDVYRCVPNGSTRTAASEQCFITPADTEIEAAVDCEAISICRLGDSCSCDEQECSIPTFQETAPVQLAIDGALDASGDTLEGTLLLGELNDAKPVIRLVRQ